MNYKKNISIIVDYAHEPESMRQVLLTLNNLIDKGEYDKIVHIVSCDGAGRDNWKKPLLGKISLDLTSFSVVTLDNYTENDDPDEIIDLLTKNFDKKLNGVKYKTTIHRSEAFDLALNKALEFAKKGLRTIIISTGVGVENGLTQPYGKIDWDERVVWKNKFAQLQ